MYKKCASHFAEKPQIKVNSSKKRKHWYLTWSDKAFTCTVVNRALPSLFGGRRVTWNYAYNPLFFRRNVPGFAIGGLSGGEEKDVFWRIVKVNILLLAKISLIFSRETQGWPFKVKDVRLLTLDTLLNLRIMSSPKIDR